VTVSANTLFHFTSTIENLRGILRSDFLPRYSVEDLSVLSPKGTSDATFSFAIPMVSFCDIPLSQVASHMAIYGNYAMGMRKNWGKSNKIAPVLYTYRRSRVAASVVRLLAAPAPLASLGRDKSVVLRQFPELLCFVKAYEGTLVHNGKTRRRHRFYDEREWRYVPRLPGSPPMFQILQSSLNSHDLLHQANGSLPPDARIRFSPRDIKYVVVSREDEIPSIISWIEDVKDRFTPEEVKLLVSRVISAAQILEDF